MGQHESGGQQEQTDVKPATINWDASTIKNAYANVCNISITQEEVGLNFGLNQVWGRTSRAMQLQQTNRIILSPFAAKRLAMTRWYKKELS